MHSNPKDCADGVCTTDFIAKVAVGVKHLEITCSTGRSENYPDPVPIALGSTRGRLVTTKSTDGFGDLYELLTPTGRVLACHQTGIAE
jgi:hypothetical protein